MYLIVNLECSLARECITVEPQNKRYIAGDVNLVHCREAVLKATSRNMLVSCPQWAVKWARAGGRLLCIIDQNLIIQGSLC